MNSWIAATFVLASLGLAACVTDPGYGPIDAAQKRHFGYVDMPNSLGGHTIRVVVPPNVSDPRVAFERWERRAAELCPDGYRKEIAIAQPNMLLIPDGAPVAMSFEVLGEAYCEPGATAPAAGE